MKKFILIATVSFFIVIPSCKFYTLEGKLSPENAEFLSKVRYIITSEERKTFLGLSDSDKEIFKDEFWKRRDPFPETEENELKIEYFKRIDIANKLFLGEGKEGWLTDRGRIYILFGPPTDRVTSPMADYCEEVWHYGNFPVVFLDRYCNGSFQLVSINLSHLQDLNIAQAQASRAFSTGGREKVSFNFKLGYRRLTLEEAGFSLYIVIAIPYSAIWFKAEEGRFTTVFDLSLELKDQKESVLWNFKNAFKVEMEEEEFKENYQKDFIIQVPFSWDENLEKFNSEKNRLMIHIKNRSGGEESHKSVEFVLHPK